MSTIEKLSIQGIRSFGPKAEDQQTITFSSPVTLILGANGCGKTTIIECLKYALTGDVPPGSGRGQSFVHDPKIFDSVECLGKVQLKVKNARNEHLTVTRSMKLGLKRGKVSFETLDATINFDKDETLSSISKRCIDVDTEMCQFMGVSEAIINNVIFCHQEDASWPLDEGKKLKEKFDAIFGTTEYNRAVDKFMKMRKDQMTVLKVKSAELKHFAQWKKESDIKELELEQNKTNMEKLKEKKTQLEEDMKPIDERLKEIQGIEINISKIETKKVRVQTELKNCEKQITKLQTNIKTPFEGDISALDLEIQKFKAEMSEKQTALTNHKDELKSIVGQQKKLQQSVTEMDRKCHTLIQKRQQEQETIAERATKIKELCEKMEIPCSINEESSVTDIENIIEEIKNGFKNEDKKIAELSASQDKVNEEKQKQIDKIRETKVTVESEITSKKQQIKQSEKDLNKLQADINNGEQAASQLDSVVTQLEELEKKVQEYEETVNFQEKKTEIQTKKETIEILQKQFTEIDEQLRILNLNSKITAEVNVKEQDIEKKNEEIRRIKSKNSDSMKKIIPDREIETNFKRTFQGAYDEIQKKLKELNKQINSNQLKEKELQIQRKNLKQELSKWEKELEDAKEKIFDKCQNTPYEELLEVSKENIQKYQLDHGALKSSELMYKNYIRKVESDPCCPLCHKNLTETEATDLSSEMNDEIQNLPENIKRAQETLKKEQKRYEELLTLKPVFEKVERLEHDIPKRKIDVSNIEKDLAEVGNEIVSALNSTTEPNSNLQLINGIMGDMSILDDAFKQINKITNDLTKLKAKLPEGVSDKSVETVESEKSTISSKLEEERKAVEKLQSEYEKETDYLNKLREKKSGLHDKKNKLQENAQNLPELKQRSEETTNKIEILKTEIKTAENQLDPLKIQLQTANEEKKALIQQNRAALKQLQSHVDGLKKINHDIERNSKLLKDLAEINLASAIEFIKKQFEALKVEQAAKETENVEVVKKIDVVKEEISNQELIQRNLNDNRDLKETIKKQDELKEQLEAHIKEVADLNYDNTEKKTLNTKREEIQVQKGEINGEIGAATSQINKLTRELKDTRYKDAVKNYQKHLYEVEVLKRVIEDLGQYRIALEWALLKFHSEKMEKINRLIREYWRQIYRGNDIDYIQIQTDEVNTSDSADKRRNYNYRVVQSKNNSIIDMRARCSAGQRVLASLIIRMALAETFSVSCGVLALDEPTTNLDRNNILSLCEALNRIVEERQAQSNFMLLIITHDEEFISTLGKIHSYSKVGRNDEGKSIIRKVKVA